jgi:hypothetical protein
MDLTQLYNLTTPELRDEAERLGVTDSYAMSRGQLIHAIRNRVAGPPSEGLLGKVLGIAKWALQPRKDAAPATPGPSPAVEEPKRFDRPADAPLPSISAESASVPETFSGSASTSTPAPTPAPAPRSAPVGVSETVSGPPSRPPAGVFSQSAGMFEEPFPTRTMARILADQGHFKRALAIYGALLRSDPRNADLRAEADEVRARSRARRPQVH